mmetsp:Transcript_20695/g.30483  ORF Transcript_20695/g.30483 Transcript_20695/m.30483 type:complete len:525 (+) Transcript_20695:470-2044(+)
MLFHKLQVLSAQAKRSALREDSLERLQQPVDLFENGWRALMSFFCFGTEAVDLLICRGDDVAALLRERDALLAQTVEAAGHALESIKHLLVLLFALRKHVLEETGSAAAAPDFVRDHERDFARVGQLHLEARRVVVDLAARNLALVQVRVVRVAAGDDGVGEHTVGIAARIHSLDDAHNVVHGRHIISESILELRVVASVDHVSLESGRRHIDVGLDVVGCLEDGLVDGGADDGAASHGSLVGSLHFEEMSCRNNVLKAIAGSADLGDLVAERGAGGVHAPDEASEALVVDVVEGDRAVFDGGLLGRDQILVQGHEILDTGRRGVVGVADSELHVDEVVKDVAGAVGLLGAGQAEGANLVDGYGIALEHRVDHFAEAANDVGELVFCIVDHHEVRGDLLVQREAVLGGVCGASHDVDELVVDLDLLFRVLQAGGEFEALSAQLGELVEVVHNEGDAFDAHLEVLKVMAENLVKGLEALVAPAVGVRGHEDAAGADETGEDAVTEVLHDEAVHNADDELVEFVLV